MPETSAPTRVIEQARDALAAFVRNAPAGTKLPPERQLAQRLGVSRTTLRDGVSRLALLGLLEVRHGDGTYVKEPQAADLLPLLRPLVEGRASTISELFALKRHLEPAVAALAARSCTDEDADSMRLAVQRERDDLREPPTTSRSGSRTTTRRRVVRSTSLNEAMAQAAGDSLLVVLVTLANELIGTQLLDGLSTAQARLATEQRSAVVEAIAAGDEQAAQEAMELHLRWLGRTLEGNGLA